MPQPATAHPVGQILAFRCGSRAFSLGQILRAAPRGGEAPEPGPASGGSVDLEAALEEFRYQRDLVSAEECERWLAARGLSYGDLVDSVARQCGLSEAEEGEDSRAVTEIDRVLSPDFPACARLFAWRVALALDHGVALPAAEEDWDDVLAEAEHEARVACAEPATRARRLAARRLELSRVVVESAEFDEPGAATEACQCVNLDHLSFDDLARESGCARDTFRGFFADLPGHWQSALLGPLGRAVALPLEDGRHLVLGLRRRALPSLDDDEVCRRLDDAAFEETCAELEIRHVQWLIAL